MSSLIPKLPQPLITLQIPFLFFTNIFSLALGPSHSIIRTFIIHPFFALLVFQSLHKEWSGVFGMQYAMECIVWSVVWVYFDWNVLQGPDREGWEKISYDKSEKEKGVNGVNGERKKGEGKMRERGFKERLWWAVRLATTQRYVGWTQEVKNVPKEVGVDYSRWLFVLRKFLRYGLFFLLHDIANAYTASSPYGAWADIIHLKPTISLVHEPFLTRFYWAWVHICLTYVGLEEMHALYAVVSVASGLAIPRDCPGAFGDLKGLVTVRKAWSSVWHQNCRRIASAPGIFLTRDVLRLRKGSFASKYLQLFVGFGVSAIVHGGASMFAHRSFNDDAAFKFFLGQTAVIMVEDHIIDLGKSFGLTSSAFWRLVGFVWTVAVLGSMSQMWTAPVVDHGMWVHDRGMDVFGIGPPAAA